MSTPDCPVECTSLTTNLQVAHELLPPGSISVALVMLVWELEYPVSGVILSYVDLKAHLVEHRPARNMSRNSISNMNQLMVVISTVEGWSALKSLQLGRFKDLKLNFSSLGSNQVCDLTVDGHLLSLLYADLKQDMTEEAISQAMDSCFKSCTDGIITFLLLIQGGHYTKRERRMVEILQAHFGAEALKYLVVASLEDGKVADTLDDALLELLNMCDGRYRRITSSAAKEELSVLLETVNCMLAENGVAGYTDAMLAEATEMSTEDSAMRLLKQKVQEVEKMEQERNKLIEQQEERRAKEMEELRVRHAEERKKETSEKKQYERMRANREEAVMSHRASMQLVKQNSQDDDTKKMSVILLGLSASGKTSALNLILERAGNQYSVDGSPQGAPQPTMFCESKEAFAAGRRLILVDTPELWDEDGVEDLDLVKDCLALASPGPHVFLLVLQVGRFTQGECEMLGHLQKIFGRDFAEHAIVLFVRFDDSQHRPQTINDYVEGAHATLQELIRKCGSRFYELNIRKSQNALSYPQVKDLLSGLSKLVAAHGGRPYSVKRFSVQELKGRKKGIRDRKERNSLLRDA